MKTTLKGQHAALVFGLGSLLLNCGAKVVGPGTDTSTDWVEKCEADTDCDPDKLCGCGLCTRECTEDADCAGLSAGAVCARSTDACDRAQTICVPNISFSWIDNQTAPTASSAAEVCPTFTAGVQQPVSRRTTFQRVEQVQFMNQAPLVDDTKLYWFDQYRRLSALSLDGILPVQWQTAVELVAAAATPQTVTGPLLSNASMVFWTETDTPPASAFPEPILLAPPSRLYGVAKAGGPAELLYESTDQVLRLVAAGNDVLILITESVEQPVFALSLADRQLHALQPEVASTLYQAVADHLYWGKASSDSNATGEYFDIYRTNFEGRNAERVASLVQGQLRVSGDYAVWQQERLVTEPSLVLDQNFVVQHLGTECPPQALPGVGESISTFTVDSSHVYWNSYNALGSVQLSAATLSSSLGISPILRANLSSGLLERLVTPGFEAEIAVDHLIAQTDKLLFVYGSVGLVAIDKPTAAEPNLCAWGVDNLLGAVGVSATQRVDCGAFNSLEASERSASAFTCLETANPELGAQVTINKCIDCSLPSVFVHAGTKVGTPEEVSAPQGTFHLELSEIAGQRSVNVERCDGLELVEGTIRCVHASALYTCVEPAAGTSEAAACRGPGHYEAGKEGSYLPCCSGLQEVFQLSATTSNGQPFCMSEPLRVYACVAGACGDGKCEVGEDKPCGCPQDCPNAAWGPAWCGDLCSWIESACGADIDSCVAECERDQQNSTSCRQEAEWQAMTECCMNTTYPTACEPSFDACQRGSCGSLRPSGAAEGCSVGM